MVSTTTRASARGVGLVEEYGLGGVKLLDNQPLFPESFAALNDMYDVRRLLTGVLT